ncbi:CCHC-type domain-containing protein [Trichonephila clavipes]|nr:CCHC-type domain-containing protein [Trichonephila clavipes]
MGPKKTLERIKYSLFWEGLSSNVKKFCESCKECQLTRSVRIKDRSPITPVARSKRTVESSWRPRPRSRQENRPTQQDTGRKTNLWCTSGNVPICFHCGRLDHVTRYCRDRRCVFSAARQRRQLDQYERWDSDS